MAGGVLSLSSLALLFFSVQLAVATVVKKPPRIIKPFVARQEFYRAGQTVSLECNATGTPSPMYLWYWNGVLVQSGTNADISIDSTTGTLTITNLDEDKEGFFKCHAQNTFANGQTCVAVSPKIEVREGRVENWDVDTEVSTLTQDEDTYAFLTCDDNLPQYFGPTNFIWYKVTGSNSQSELALDERQFVDNDGTLHFSFLKESDQLTGEFYACALSNAVEGAIHVGSKKRIIVDAPTSSSDLTPLKRYPPGSHTVTFKLGQEARLECFFSGKPTPTVTWERNSEAITTQGRFELENDGRVLKITKLKESDEGNYQCVGTSGQNSASGTVFLNVTSVPIWNNRLQDQIRVQDEDALFYCDTRAASGETTPNAPIWYKNNLRLDLYYNSNKYMFMDNKRQMKVLSVQKDQDIACYQCTVINSVGEVFSAGCLNVILPITITEQPSSEQEVSEGDVVNLTVTAITDPLMSLSYKWVFKNVTYRDPEHPPSVTFNSVTKTAFINTTGFSADQMDDIAGVYQRIIYHSYQTKIIEVDVVVEDDTPPVPITAAGFDYWIIGLIIGILLIILVIIIICCVCRRKMLEGDYPVDKKETAAGLDPEKELKDSGFGDLSRADYDYLPEKKGPGNMEFDDNIPLGDDESFGEDDYGDEAQAFTEDGSFIGVYSKTKKDGPPGYQPAESNV